MENPTPKNNLAQEELYFKELSPTKVPEQIDQNIDQFLYAVEYKSEEAILRKFAFAYVLATLTIISFYHQLGAGIFNFDIGQILNFLGPALKQFINGLCFNAIAIAAVLILSFNKSDLELLMENKEKNVYGITFFIWLFLCMFGSEFTWGGAGLWIIGASLGAGLGLNFGIKFIQEQLPD